MHHGLDVLAILSSVIAVASVLHMILPPYEVFEDFPNAKKYYKLIVIFIGYIAMNKRAHLVSKYNKVKSDANGTLQK